MIRAVVTDIEGTTTALSFVKDVLFPYAREHMAEFICANEDTPAVAEQLAEVRKITGKELDTNAVIAQLIEWIDQDKKITPLKTLQGIMWEDGYRRNEYKAHVYDDALQNLKKWNKQGIRLYVYSSGSVFAQKLLFAHTEEGDITPLFSGYFDTHVGGKMEVESYRAIAKKIALPPEDILFLSDIEQELGAAREAGMHTTWLVREGELDSNASHQQVRSFDEIVLGS
jgi:enolase-phosphatase E1